MKRIFMLSSQLMFGQGVMNLLQGQVEVEIVGRETELEKGFQQIHELQPDVVIMESNTLTSISSTVLVKILEEAPEAKVIVLNLENDQMRVYRGEQRPAECISDLMMVIKEDG